MAMVDSRLPISLVVSQSRFGICLTRNQERIWTKSTPDLFFGGHVAVWRATHLLL